MSKSHLLPIVTAVCGGRLWQSATVTDSLLVYPEPVNTLYLPIPLSMHRY